MMARSGQRTSTILVSAALAAALAIAAIAAPAAAAKKPKCMGHRATIVGTDKADVLKGTAKRDVIVAKGGADIIVGRGGNDIICAGPGNDRVAGQAGHDRIAGQAGADRLFGGGGVDRLMGGLHGDLLAGGPGPDVLFGQGGNDRLHGGVGIDRCIQGVGTGPKARCEPPVVPVEPVPKDLIVAYADLDGNKAFGVGDVLISKLVDSDLDGIPSVGDTIVMDRYPTKWDPKVAADFADWNKETHLVTYADHCQPASAEMHTAAGRHTWYTSDLQGDTYWEGAGGSAFAEIADRVDGMPDVIKADPGVASPSQPSVPVWKSAVNGSDARFLEIYIDCPGSGI